MKYLADIVEFSPFSKMESSEVICSDEAIITSNLSVSSPGRSYAESADVEHDTSTVLSQYDFGVDKDDDETTVAHADIAIY
ncbi:unnamed protein product [Phytophthora lilii]|uniref:Unnamed protein product n=1 Tax=Phytophthora lilii TaxID=2077276 RepID=A0A9W6WRT8_9STRA|nr:unnamed protein product [Phytophthora lilii]